MKAVVIRRFGGPEVLEVAELPVPVPGQNEVRVRVATTAVARTKDVAARAGTPPFAPQIHGFPHVLGTEHAGVVDAVGAGADPALVGRRVAVSAVLSCQVCAACRRGRDEACPSLGLIGVHRAGSYAEYCVVPAGNLYPLPTDVSFAQATSLAANGAVARAQLDAGAVSEGTTVLIVGAAGALGSTAVALAAFRKARVIGVDQLAAKPDCLDGLPLDGAVDGAARDLGQQVLAISGTEGVDCIIDNLGLAALWESYPMILANMGRVVVSGAVSHDPIPLRVLPFYVRNQSLLGVRTGNRQQMSALWGDVAAGFRPTVGFVSTYDWQRVAEVHANVERGASHGQAVLAVTSEEFLSEGPSLLPG